MKINDNWKSTCIDFLDKNHPDNNGSAYALPSRCYQYELSDFDGFASVAKQFGRNDLLEYIDRIKRIWSEGGLPDLDHMHFASHVRRELRHKKKSVTCAKVEEALLLNISRFADYKQISAATKVCMDAVIQQRTACRMAEEARQFMEGYQHQ